MAEKNTNVVIIDGNPYDVEIYLIKGCSDTGVIPIAYSSLKYLEISNDLANIGYTGKIIFTNFNNILEKLNIFCAVNNAPTLYFKLRSLGFGNETSTYDDIFFFAALTEGQDFKLNAIDGNSAYNFEELYVFNLKTTKAIRNNLYYQTTYNSVIPVDKLLKFLLTFNVDIPSAVSEFDQNPFGTIGRSNKTMSMPTLSAVDNHILREVEVVGQPASDAISLTPIVDLKNSTVLYDAIMSLYPYLSFLPKSKELIIDGENWYDPGIIKIENDRTTNGTRKIIMFPLLSTIQSFFDTVSKKGNKVPGAASSNTDNYYKNLFLTEKFNIAQSDSAEYLSDNTVDKYELKRVNYKDVLVKKWVTTKCCGESRDGCSSGKTRTYLKTRQVFEQICVSPHPCNLPDIPADSDTVKIYNKSDIAINLALAYGTNSVLKSFVFDNLAVVFRVKGQPYRKPNRFISINPPQVDKELGETFKDKEEISGYWYVVSVNHIFENGNYFNEFTCVKLYDLNSSVSSGVLPATSNNPADAPDGGNAPSSNGGEINGGSEAPKPDLFNFNTGPIPGQNTGSVLPELPSNKSQETESQETGNDSLSTEEKERLTNFFNRSTKNPNNPNDLEP